MQAMQLTLQLDEVTLLKDILTSYLSDLRMEIGDTENYELREDLKRDEEMIKVLLARLAEIGAS